MRDLRIRLYMNDNCAGSFNQVVLQPTSMNLPAKKYEFNAVFDALSTHEAVFAQVHDSYGDEQCGCQNL
jgi:hypothetical protein